MLRHTRSARRAPRHALLFTLGLTLAGQACAALETAGQAVGLISIAVLILLTPAVAVGVGLARWVRPARRTRWAVAVWVGLWLGLSAWLRRGDSWPVTLLNPVLLLTALPYGAGCALGMRWMQKRADARAALAAQLAAAPPPPSP